MPYKAVDQMQTEQAKLCIIKKPKAFKIVSDANVVCVMSLVINMCLSALMTAQPPFFFHGTKSVGKGDDGGQWRRHRWT